MIKEFGKHICLYFFSGKGEYTEETNNYENSSFILVFCFLKIIYLDY